MDVDVYKENVANLDEWLGVAEVTCHKLFSNVNGNGTEST